MSDAESWLRAHPGAILVALAALALAVFWRDLHPAPADPAPLVDPRSMPQGYANRQLPAQGPVDGWIPAETYNQLLAEFQALENAQAQQQFLQGPPPGNPGGYEQAE